MIYLDNASTTQMDCRVLDAMMPYLNESYGNAGTLHSLGRQAADAVSNARHQVANLINASPKQIVFTSGGTEANNMVFAGIRDHLLKKRKTRIVSTMIEHDSVLNAIKKLTDDRYTEFPFYSHFIAPDGNGKITTDAVQNTLKRKDVGIMSIMYTNNETGVENTVHGIGKVCNKAGVLFHTDAVQTAGYAKIDVKEIQCDFLSLSAHKIHGPKGIGALYVRNPSILHPMICGGANQEFGLRGGTENVAAIVGFGAACEFMQSQFETDLKKIHDIKQTMCETIKFALKERGLEGIFHINGTPALNGKTLSMRFDGVDAETLLILLDTNGVCVSAGSACQSHESKPSRVLISMGIAPELARNTIRISFSRMNECAEAKRAAEIIVNCVSALLHES